MRDLAFSKVVACSNADIKVVLANVGAELWEEVACCATAPRKGVDNTKDPKVVDEEEQRRVNCSAFLGSDGWGSDGWLGHPLSIYLAGEGGSSGSGVCWDRHGAETLLVRRLYLEALAAGCSSLLLKSWKSWVNIACITVHR